MNAMRWQMPLFVLLAVQSTQLFGQQLSLFTQYREQATMLNPAALEQDFITTGRNLTFGASHRVQWAGIEGAPKTQTVRISYINSEASGAALNAGGYMFNDQTGPTGFTGVYGRLGAVISDDPQYRGFSAALSGGLVQYRIDASKIRLRDPNDVIGQQDQNQLYPDLGLGLYFYETIRRGAFRGDMFYAGLSIPQILGLNLTFTDPNGDFLVERTRHFYGMAGFYKFTDNDGIIEPSVWVKYVDGAPVNADFNLRYQFPTSFWIGTGVATSGNFHMETGFNLGDNMGLDNNIRVGYGFDAYFSSFGPTAGYTHEIQLSISFDR